MYTGRALVAGRQQHANGMSWGFKDCEHDPELCRCYARPLPGAASLDELQFSRSACSHAQTGAIDKLEALLQRQPAAVHSDGGAGGAAAASSSSSPQLANVRTHMLAGHLLFLEHTVSM